MLRLKTFGGLSLEGQLDVARHAAAESGELRRRIDDRYGQAETLFIQAEIAHREHSNEEAGALLDASRAIRVSLGDHIGVAECDAARATRASSRASA